MSIVKQSVSTTDTVMYADGGGRESQHTVRVVLFRITDAKELETPDTVITPESMEITYTMGHSSAESRRSWNVKLTGPCPPKSWNPSGVVRLYSYMSGFPSWIINAVEENLPDGWEKCGY